MIRGVPKEIAELKYELESIKDFINKGDRLADAEKDMEASHEIKAKIKQLIEVSFHIEDALMIISSLRNNMLLILDVLLVLQTVSKLWLSISK